MAKIKLSTNQKRNVKARHNKLLKTAQDKEIVDESFDSNSYSELKNGIVISRFGKQADIEEVDSRQVYRCFIRRTIDSIITGDKVLFRTNTQNTEEAGLVEALQERTSLLSRPDRYDGIKPIASNLTKIAIVCTKEPEFSTNILDRYLVACEQAKILPIIVINKIELFETEEEINYLNGVLDVYQKIGYKVYKTSTFEDIGITELKNEIKTDNCIFVGQSGVGKSSLLNKLVPEAKALTNVISEISGLGQHTTTNSKLYHFEEGGIIIDSPGVRGFALWHLTNQQVTNSYKEFLPFLGTCKFRDCKHENDKGCAIIQAVKDGHIAKFRLENYYQILKSMENDKPDAYVAPGRKYGK